MALQKMEGSTVISTYTLLRILQSLRPTPLSSNSTLFDAGVEEHKRHMALILKRELKISVPQTTVDDMIEALK